ncbi:MAG: hypothetical protein LBR72_03815, partial [Oscillospiraceae bacterium]|nr:hypothetical protein [Oscillospiraceae bacterium]
MPYTKEAIMKAAREVHRLSLKYQLAEAAIACDELLKDTLIGIAAKKKAGLWKRFWEVSDRGDDRELSQIKADIIDMSRSRYHVVVQFLPKVSLETAYTTYINGDVYIYLSEKLAGQSVDAETGGYTEHGRTLRRKMAHELGHIMLHIEMLVDASYARGSGKI